MREKRAAMKRWTGIWIMGILLNFPVWAQEFSEVEKILESNDLLHTEEGYEDLVNTLIKLYNAPLNLNTASFDSLKMLFFLSDSQIDHILAFRRKHGNFLHLNELLLVKGIGRKDLENIRPFMHVGNSGLREKIPALKRKSLHELLVKAKFTLPRQEGYKIYSPSDFKTEKAYLKKQETRFKGIPLGTLMKYKVKINSGTQAGLTLENDAGEPYFTSYQKTGFDFLSFHVAFSRDHWMRKLIVGDYRVQWGQGLTAWGGFTSGKSSLAVGNEKSGKGFSPYTSTDENNFFRGIAVSLQPGTSVSADVFCSYKKTDGNLLGTDSLAQEDLLTASLYRTGYHRNRRECEKKHTFGEFTTGMSVKWNTPRFRVGINTLYYHFKPEIHRGDAIYRKYEDNGQNRFLLSLDYKTGYASFYLFGETAFSENGAFATLNGVRYSGNSRVTCCALYRRYGKKYTSHYAGGFGEYSNTSNEEGIYIGMELKPLKGLEINAYYDRFRFFFPRYNAFFPGAGNEWLLAVVYRHSRYEHQFRFKKEDKPENGRKPKFIPVQRKRSEFRYQLNVRLSPRFSSRSRIDLVFYRKAWEREKGYLVYQDILFTSSAGKFNSQIRLAYFDTDSYKSRIYSYENNVLYGYSFPAYSGKGIRTYLNLNWKAHRCVTFYLKTGLTYYPERDYIGSGVTKTEGNKLFDTTLQMRLKF